MSTNTPVKLNISDLPSTSRCPVHWHASLNNMCHSGSSISDLYDIVDAIRSMTISDADNLEANLVLDLARARRDVVNAEKVLADCVVHEHEVLANLSKHKSDISKQKLAKADVGIAHMRITFQKHGLSHHGPAQSVLQESLECHHITVQLD